MWKLTGVIISGLLPIELYRIFMRDHLMLSEMFAICVIFRHFVYFTYLHRLFFLVFFFFCHELCNTQTIAKCLSIRWEVASQIMPEWDCEMRWRKRKKEASEWPIFSFFFNFFLSFVGHLRMCACILTMLVWTLSSRLFNQLLVVELMFLPRYVGFMVCKCIRFIRSCDIWI